MVISRHPSQPLSSLDIPVILVIPSQPLSSLVIPVILVIPSHFTHP